MAFYFCKIAILGNNEINLAMHGIYWIDMVKKMSQKNLF